MTKHIKEDSCAYLKGWLDELKESPQFIGRRISIFFVNAVTVIILLGESQQSFVVPLILECVRIEGIATIHQDNSVGCEKSGFSDYPKGG